MQGFLLIPGVRTLKMKTISVNHLAKGVPAKAIATGKPAKAIAKALQPAKAQRTVITRARDLLAIAAAESQSPFLDLIPLNFGKDLYLARLRVAPHRLIIVEKMNDIVKK